MISFSVAIPAPRSASSAALPPDFMMLGLLEGRRGICEILVEPAPERPCPRAEVGPALPEDLEGRFIERAGSLIGGRGLGDALALVEGLQKTLGSLMHGSSSLGRSLVRRRHELRVSGRAERLPPQRSQAPTGGSVGTPPAWLAATAKLPLCTERAPPPPPL